MKRSIIIFFFSFLFTISLFSQTSRTQTVVAFGTPTTNKYPCDYDKRSYYIYQTCYNCTNKDLNVMKDNLEVQVRNFLGDNFMRVSFEIIYEKRSWAIINISAKPAGGKCTYNSYVFGSGNSVNEAVESAKKNMLSFYTCQSTEVSQTVPSW